MIELFEALHDYFESHADAAELKAALTGGLYNLEAPEDVDFPYGAFQLISDVPDHFASDKFYLENCLFQFNLFSKKSSSRELLNVYDKLISAFDFLILTITGYTALSCVRENTIQVPKLDGVWQLNVLYRIFLEPD